jgi:hypothetical protein
VIPEAHAALDTVPGIRSGQPTGVVSRNLRQVWQSRLEKLLSEHLNPLIVRDFAILSNGSVTHFAVVSASVSRFLQAFVSHGLAPFSDWFRFIMVFCDNATSARVLAVIVHVSLDVFVAQDRIVPYASLDHG